MAKEKPHDSERAARKAEKKALKEAKRAETDGVHKSKKEKKAKERAIDIDAENLQSTTRVMNAIEAEKPGSVVIKDDEEQKIEIKTKPLVGALVPFANPLSDERTTKKVLKAVKKAHHSSALKRGVKEVVKVIRKSPVPGPSFTGTPPYICILAGDISPMDVISHLPVLCEDHHIPYIFVPSRANLGAAGLTQRPTSVMLVAKEKGKKRGKAKENGGESGKEEDWDEIYDDLVKIVRKAGEGVRI